MTPNRKHQIRAYLTNRIPRWLRGVEIKPPDDSEVKNYILLLSAEELHAIYHGPGGDRFHQMTKDALGRIAAEDLKDKPPANGRTPGLFLEFNQKEVLPDTRSKPKN